MDDAFAIYSFSLEDAYVTLLNVTEDTTLSIWNQDKVLSTARFSKNCTFPGVKEGLKFECEHFCTKSNLTKPKGVFIVISKIYVNLRQKYQNKVEFSMKDLDQTRNKSERASLV